MNLSLLFGTLFIGFLCIALTESSQGRLLLKSFNRGYKKWNLENFRARLCERFIDILTNKDALYQFDCEDNTGDSSSHVCGEFALNIFCEVKRMVEESCFILYDKNDKNGKKSFNTGDGSENEASFKSNDESGAIEDLVADEDSTIEETLSTDETLREECRTVFQGTCEDSDGPACNFVAFCNSAQTRVCCSSLI